MEKVVLGSATLSQPLNPWHVELWRDSGPPFCLPLACSLEQAQVKARAGVFCTLKSTQRAHTAVPATPQLVFLGRNIRFLRLGAVFKTFSAPPPPILPSLAAESCSVPGRILKGFMGGHIN